MAEPEDTSYRESFQIINSLEPLEYDAIQEVFYKKKFEVKDPYFFRALGNKLEQIRNKLNLQGLHAIVCGVNCNLFVLKNQNGFGIYYDCSYSGCDEKIASIESCYFTKKTDGTFKNFMCSRYQKVLVCGYRVTIDFDPEILEFEETFSDTEACLIQQHVDIQNQNFLPEYAQEIEVKL